MFALNKSPSNKIQYKNPIILLSKVLHEPTTNDSYDNTELSDYYSIHNNAFKQFEHDDVKRLLKQQGQFEKHLRNSL